MRSSVMYRQVSPFSVTFRQSVCIYTIHPCISSLSPKIRFQHAISDPSLHYNGSKVRHFIQINNFDIKIFKPDSLRSASVTERANDKDICTKGYSKSILRHNTSGPPVPATPVYATANAGSARYRHWPPATRPSSADNCPSHR